MPVDILMPKVKKLRLDEIDRSRFTEKTLLGVAADLKSGRTPLSRMQVVDDVVAGLRAMIFKDGGVTYHTSYTVGDERPFLKIGKGNAGDPDYITIEDARELTRTIKALGEKGVDVRDALLPRLRRELLKDGTRWRIK
jgi:hypothetical protein